MHKELKMLRKKIESAKKKSKNKKIVYGVTKGLMTHDALLKLPMKQKILAGDAYAKMLAEMAGKPLEERKKYFEKNKKRFRISGFDPPSEHDDVLALYAFYCYEACLKANNKTCQKKMEELAKICIEAYNINSKVPALPAIHYNDLLDIAKRCIEVVEEHVYGQ
ncbi:MAG: hypothetical protein QXK37_04415 [Candidatus Woesearchaeota archaeon]